MLSAIYHVLGITFFFAVYWPGVQPDARLEVELAAARAPITGDNGYRALPKDWPQERWPQDNVPLCPRETDDCLAWAREHLDAYRAVAVALQERDAVAELVTGKVFGRDGQGIRVDIGKDDVGLWLVDLREDPDAPAAAAEVEDGFGSVVLPPRAEAAFDEFGDG